MGGFKKRVGRQEVSGALLSEQKVQLNLKRASLGASSSLLAFVKAPQLRLSMEPHQWPP